MKKQRTLSMDEKKLLVTAVSLTSAITLAGAYGRDIDSLDKKNPRGISYFKRLIPDLIKAYNMAKQNVPKTTSDFCDQQIQGILQKEEIWEGLSKWKLLGVKL
jgi:hypothetical protein